jgi:hypothetical protein
MAPRLISAMVPLVQLETVVTVVHVSPSAKVAVTDLAADIVTVQVPVPVQAPDQPVNMEPVAGAAVSVTLVPGAYTAPHAVPQLIPPTLEVTVPLPAPALATLRGYCPTAQVPPGEVPDADVLKVPLRQ